MCFSNHISAFSLYLTHRWEGDPFPRNAHDENSLPMLAMKIPPRFSPMNSWLPKLIFVSLLNIFLKLQIVFPSLQNGQILAQLWQKIKNWIVILRKVFFIILFPSWWNYFQLYLRKLPSHQKSYSHFPMDNSPHESDPNENSAFTVIATCYAWIQYIH